MLYFCIYKYINNKKNVVNVKKNKCSTLKGVHTVVLFRSKRANIDNIILPLRMKAHSKCRRGDVFDD